MKSFIESKIKQAQKEMDERKPTVDRLQKETEQLKKVANARFDDYMKHILSDTHQKSSDDARAMASKKSNEYLDAYSSYLSFSQGPFYMTDLPDAQATTKTDSDGEFNFKLKPEIRCCRACIAGRRIEHGNILLVRMGCRRR